MRLVKRDNLVKMEKLDYQDCLDSWEIKANKVLEVSLVNVALLAALALPA